MQALWVSCNNSWWLSPACFEIPFWWPTLTFLSVSLLRNDLPGLLILISAQVSRDMLFLMHYQAVRSHSKWPEELFLLLEGRMNASWMRWSYREWREHAWLIFHVCWVQWSWCSAGKVQWCSTLAKQALLLATANWDGNLALAWISPTAKCQPPRRWLGCQCGQQHCGSVDWRSVRVIRVRA